MKRFCVRMVNPGTRAATAQITAGGDVRDEVEVAEPWGLTSCPPDAPADGRGAEGVLAELNDCADHPIIFPLADRRYRPTDCQKGETIVWDASGQRVSLLKTGVKITAVDGKPVDIEAPGGVNLKNNTTVSGSVDATGFRSGEFEGKTTAVSIPTPGGPAVLVFINGLYVRCSGAALEVEIPPVE